MPKETQYAVSVTALKTIHRPAHAARAADQARDCESSMTDRNEGDIRFIPRSTVIGFMRANYQDPVGFHEAMCAHLDIEEEEYAFDGTLRGRLEALKQDLANTDANDTIDDGAVLRRAIHLAQTIGLSGDEEFIDETTPWFEANGLPTPRARAADAS